MSSENVFNVRQMGAQAGTFYAPGAAVAATFLYPVEDPVDFQLDRASAYPDHDLGRNVRNNPGSGYHGVRGASTTLTSQVRFDDTMDIPEMTYQGSTSPPIRLAAIPAPGASPWTLSADILGFDREIEDLTLSLTARSNLQVAQGHLTRLYEGTTATAYASLTEIDGSLKSFTMTAERHLTLRAYGGADDLPLAFGFTEK